VAHPTHVVLGAVPPNGRGATTAADTSADKKGPKGNPVSNAPVAAEMDKNAKKGLNTVWGTLALAQREIIS
jgi:hypothetical protein